MRVPCYGCGERREGCHAVCERYRAYDEERKAMREESSQWKEAQRTVISGKKEYLDKIAVREKRRGRRIR